MSLIPSIRKRSTVRELVNDCKILLEGMYILYEDFASEIEPERKSEYLDELRSTIREYKDARMKVHNVFRNKENIDIYEDLYILFKDIDKKYKHTFHRE